MNARAIRRFLKQLPNDVLQIASTGTTQLDGDELANRIIALNVAAGATVSFPRTTGSGMTFWVVVLKVSTTGYILDCDPTTDGFYGSISVNLTGSTSTGFASGTSSNNVITLNGTTTGGSQIGDTLQFIDLAAGTWAVSGDIIGTGSVATPFS
jgi:hypothetical protein